MVYKLNPTGAQRSIIAKLKAEYPHVPILPDGLLDDDNDSILKFPNGSIKPFIIPRFTSPRRARKGRSIAFEKLDSHNASVDVVVVARNPTEARELLNDVGDRLIGWKPENAGGIVKGEAIWEPSRATVDAQNRPTRWAAQDRFTFGIQAVHTV